MSESGTIKDRLGPQITQILHEWQSGNREALDQLVPIVYRELRAIASRRLGRDRGNNRTLQTTALVHEAYVRLVDQTRVDWQGRAHFFAVAARVMRRVVLDEARRRKRGKRGGGAGAVSVDAIDELATDRELPDIVDVITLDRALTDLEAIDPDQAQIVELRFFAGLTVDEIGTVMKVSPRTVKREWAIARAWLYRALTDAAARPADD
jgi:RNA polymerase sigma factor (TIGR02999 family)